MTLKKARALDETRDTWLIFIYFYSKILGSSRGSCKKGEIRCNSYDTPYHYLKNQCIDIVMACQLGTKCFSNNLDMNVCKVKSTFYFFFCLDYKIPVYSCFNQKICKLIFKEKIRMIIWVYFCMIFFQRFFKHNYTFFSFSNTFLYEVWQWMLTVYEMG